MNLADYNRLVKSMHFRVGDIIKYTHPDRTSKSHRALSKQYGDRYYRVTAADPIHAYMESMSDDDVFSIFQWSEFRLVSLEEYLGCAEIVEPNWGKNGQDIGRTSVLDLED